MTSMNETEKGAADEPERARKVVVAHSIKAIGRETWDACANPHGSPARATSNPSSSGSAPAVESEHEAESVSENPESVCEGDTYNPLVSFDFLNSLEKSGCVGAQAGWLQHHLAVEDDDGTTVAVMPAYLKDNSFGEYIFDHGWADAYERAGGRYYPKIQSAVPFSPVPGRRILTAKDQDAEFETMVSAALALNDAARASSIHWTFCTRDEWDRFGEMGFLRRMDRQFHWYDRGYGDFDGFLDALASRKRKAIRKERREAIAESVSIECVTGSDITEEHWDAFFNFYMDTGARKWGRPYLNRDFFALIGESMANRVLLIMARRAGQLVAGALNFIGDQALYGRHWGCTEHHPFLHFEICYYQAIDWALQNGLKRVEAGHQGEHKLARGYEPVSIYSAHYIADPGLRHAVDDYLQRERAAVEEEIDVLGEYAPFRKG
ncbi:GNAT family N-acetyltransferase [Tepidamorphus sp. 3E244]|uniref:GNAT family N-acetyltransferase n=1 Tax=Tepidamorphus sp. 3E244 TaxID=3385498 RepID=UPI0038FC3835